MLFSRFSGRRVAGVLGVLALVTTAGETVARAETLVCAGSSEEGQRQRAAGKLVAARNLFLACSKSVCPAVVRDDCTQWLGELEKEIPSIVLAVHDTSGKDTTGSVVIDGASSRIPDGHPDLIDPGSHTFRVDSNGKVAESTVIVNQGEKNRLIVLTVDASAADDSHNGKSVVVTSSRPIYPYIIAGAGVITLGVGVLFQFTALSQDTQSKDSTLVTASNNEIKDNPSVCGVANPPQAQCPQTYAKDNFHSSAQNDQTASLVLLPVGAGLIVAGIIAIAVTWPSPIAKTSLRLVPSVTGKQSSLMLVGTF